MKYTKILFMLIIASLVIIAGCATKTVEPTSNFPSEEDVEETKPIIPALVKVNYEDVEQRFKLDKTTYIQMPADTYGDESSLNRIDGSYSFEIATRVTMTYQPRTELIGVDIPLTINDLVTDRTVYSGSLLEGTNDYDMVFEIDNPGMAPRFEACFGGEICVQLRGGEVQNSIDTTINSFGFNIERGTTTKKLIVSNQGVTHLTAFVYLPQGDDFTLAASEEKISLAPGAEKTITISASGTRDFGKVFANIYALPNSCEMSEECANSAKIKNELTISFN